MKSPAESIPSLVAAALVEKAAASAPASATLRRLWIFLTTFFLDRRRFASIGIAFAVLTVAVVALATLRELPSPGMSWRTVGADRIEVTWVMAGGFASDAGFRAGDVLETATLPAGSPGWQAYTVIHGAKRGETIVLARRWSPVLDLSLMALGLEFLCAGLVVYLLAVDRTVALRFSALATIISFTLVSFPAVGNGLPWALVCEWVGSKAGMAAFSYFFLTVPEPRWAVLRRMLLWAPIPILLLYGISALFRPDVYYLVKSLGYSYMAVGALASIAAMVLPHAAPSPRSQRWLWPVAAGSGAAAALYLAGSLLPYLVVRRYLMPPEVSLFALGLIPLGLAWAALRYPVMGLNLGPWAVVKAVFESISDPIFVIDRNGRLIDASRAGLKLLGIGRVTEAGDSIRTLISGLEEDLSTSGDNRSPLELDAIGGQVVHDLELRLPNESGGIAYYSVDATPIYSERGEFSLEVLVLRDITARKRREIAREEAERQKDDFLAAVSHDLRTPLTAIKYSVGVVLANEPGDFPPPMHRMLTNVDRAADRMAILVDDLLELARLQSGQVQLRVRSHDLRGIVRRAISIVEPLATSVGQTIHTNLPDEPCWALVDESRIERAIVNLLANAHKHGRGGGTIWLKLSVAGSEPTVEVSDDGPGIPQDELTRIFDRFYRIGDPDSCSRGSGLGLPIARAMIELHGGRLVADNRPGSGAVFRIVLPGLSREEVEVDENPDSR